MRPSEFKIRYDPNLDRYVMKHVHDETVYGEGFSDVVKSVGKKLLGKTAKSIAKTAAKSAATKAATKTGEYAGKKAGDKIVELDNNSISSDGAKYINTPKFITTKRINS